MAKLSQQVSYASQFAASSTLGRTKLNSPTTDVCLFNCKSFRYETWDLVTVDRGHSCTPVLRMLRRSGGWPARCAQGGPSPQTRVTIRRHRQTSGWSWIWSRYGTPELTSAAQWRWVACLLSCSQQCRATATTPHNTTGLTLDLTLCI